MWEPRLLRTLWAYTACFRDRFTFLTIYFCSLLLVKDTTFSSWRWHWPHSLSHETSAPAETLGLWVRIPVEKLMSLCIYSVFVLSCVGRGPATGSSPFQDVVRTSFKIHNSIINSEWEQARQPDPSRWKKKFLKISSLRLWSHKLQPLNYRSNFISATLFLIALLESIFLTRKVTLVWPQFYRS
jgi:hypothetical protein